MGPFLKALRARHGIAFSDDTALIFEWIVVERRL